MDILSDVDITGHLTVLKGNITTNALYAWSHVHTGIGKFTGSVCVGGCLSLCTFSLTKTILVPAQCTRFSITCFYVDGGESEEETNTKYPLLTAYRGGNKVDMDVEILKERNCGSTFTEFIIGNITSCSSPMTLKVSMLV